MFILYLCWANMHNYVFIMHNYAFIVHNYAKYAYFRIICYSDSSDFPSILLNINLPVPVTAYAPVTEVATA